MPRQVVVLSFFFAVVLGLGAADFGAPVDQPHWTLSGPSHEVTPGVPFEVTATVSLPEGYYQDFESPFLHFDPVGVTVVSSAHSPPTLRAGKQSFTGTFTLTKTLVLPPETPVGAFLLKVKVGWQICQVDGLCLLPAESTLSLDLRVNPAPQGALEFWTALLGAFLGGLLLNLMPCVFPVLALKAVGLASAAGVDLRSRRRDALAFALGGLTTVLALGTATAAAAWAGTRLEWGFAFQQPWFVWVLVLVFWTFTLQLWGVWSWSGSPFALSVSAQPGTLRSFAGGALLLVAAAPCTAPLLGPALGFAFTLPPAVIPLFFAAAGLGLVLPLLVVQWLPSWGRWLPRPGRWMVTFEKAAGFVLAATVVYLVWVFTQQTRADEVWLALLTLLVTAAALGASTRWPNAWVRVVAGLVMVFALVVGALESTRPAPIGSPPSDSTLPSGWKSFSPAAVEKALAEDHPVFVDATAAWCATCQVNELAVLGRPDVDTLMDTLGIVRLRADYTRPDPAIRDWLASVGRAGLPVYALYRPGRPLVLFPELLTTANFVDRLSSLTADLRAP